MEEIVKTTLLEYEKSTFLIDLIKTEKSALYISLQQIINAETKIKKQIIKINSNVISDIIQVLIQFKELLTAQNKYSKTSLSAKKEEEIIKRYFKGLEIKDLALQFNFKETTIEQILINNGIEVISNKLPKEYRRRGGRRRR